MKPPILSATELAERLAEAFPEAFNERAGLEILNVAHGFARLRQHHREGALRPGGTVSGPILMALVDVAMYVALLASIGWVPLAVTTSLNINFLRKPAPGPLVAEARLLKLGKRLAVGDVAIRVDGNDDMVAHATSTYSIPHHEHG